MSQQAPALYIHVPFCDSKCAYCSFASYIPEERDRSVQRWLAALHKEADERLQGTQPEFQTIFVGGGTPTFLAEDELKSLLSLLSQYILPVSNDRAGETTMMAYVAGTARDMLRPNRAASDLEFTIEANPESLTQAKAEILKRYGVNRISLGVQSLDDSMLMGLGRRHTSGDVRRAAEMLREQGFGNISFDLMFGLPGQDMDIWRHSVSAAAAMNPEHLSLYGLSVEPGTPLASRMSHCENTWRERTGNLPCDEDIRHLPSDDTQADMYEWAVDYLAEQGYRRYETSNFAKPGFECRHNDLIWHGEDYIGLGAGAVSTQRDVRRTNSFTPNMYSEHLSAETSAETSTETLQALRTVPFTQEHLTKEQLMSEYMILGLRTTRGVSKEAFYHRFNIYLEVIFDEFLVKYRSQGVLAVEGDRIFLNSRYFFVANAVLQDCIL
jgi:oxygen-independent coproporphyrinogen-3 oxidase